MLKLGGVPLAPPGVVAGHATPRAIGVDLPVSGVVMPFSAGIRFRHARFLVGDPFTRGAVPTAIGVLLHRVLGMAALARGLLRRDMSTALDLLVMPGGRDLQALRALAATIPEIPSRDGQIMTTFTNVRSRHLLALGVRGPGLDLQVVGIAAPDVEAEMVERHPRGNRADRPLPYQPMHHRRPTTHFHLAVPAGVHSAAPVPTRCSAARSVDSRPDVCGRVRPSHGPNPTRRKVRQQWHL
jgi:hypothetical protein